MFNKFFVQLFCSKRLVHKALVRLTWKAYQPGAVEPQIGKKNEKPQNKTKIEVAVENEDKMVTGSVNMSVQDEPADIMGDALHEI